MLVRHQFRAVRHLDPHASRWLSSAISRGPRPSALSARMAGRSRTGRCRDRDAAPSDEGSPRCARSGRARGTRHLHPRSSGGGRKRVPRPEHACGAPGRPLLLEEVEALLASKALVVDVCRFVVRTQRDEASAALRSPPRVGRSVGPMTMSPGMKMNQEPKMGASRFRLGKSDGASACRPSDFRFGLA
jgi:hypothetical protein